MSDTYDDDTTINALNAVPSVLPVRNVFTDHGYDYNIQEYVYPATDDNYTSIEETLADDIPVPVPNQDENTWNDAYEPPIPFYNDSEIPLTNEVEQDNTVIENNISWQDIFLSYLWQYLDYRLIASTGTRNNGFTPDFFDNPYPDPQYEIVARTAESIVDTYVRIDSAALEEQIKAADVAASSVLAAYQRFGPHTFENEIQYYFLSVPYSNLPVLLLNSLGLVEAHFNDVLARQPSLYPNEWRALLAAGFSLCKFNSPDDDTRRHSYLWWLTSNISKDRFLNSFSLDPATRTSVNALPSLPGYTADDIVANVTECFSLDLDKVRQELRKVSRGIEAEERHLIALQNDETYVPDEGLQITIDQRKEEINLRRQSVDAVEEAISQLEKMPSRGNIFQKLLQLQKAGNPSADDILDVAIGLHIEPTPEEENALRNDRNYRQKYIQYLNDLVQTI